MVSVHLLTIWPLKPQFQQTFDNCFDDSNFEHDFDGCSHDVQYMHGLGVSCGFGIGFNSGDRDESPLGGRAPGGGG